MVRKPISELTIHEYLERIEPLKRAFDMLPDHVVITDPNGNILYMNKAAERNTGYSVDEALGRNPGDLWGGLMSKDLYQSMWQTIKIEKKPYVGEVKNRRRDGTEYWQEVHISPLFDAKGDISFFIGVEPNITDRKQKDEFRDKFLGIVGHQVRDPLASIKWALEWLSMRGDLSTSEQEALQEAYTQSQTLADLVNDLLVLSRVETDTIKKETINLEKEIELIIADCQKKHPQVTFQASVEGEFLLLTPKSLALQVFRNIITNAAEYSDKPGGKVILSLRRNPTSYVFECKDNGIGIPEVEKSKIFTRFFRASNAERIKHGGTGLGLSIAKMITDSLQWSLSFMSEEGSGTSFTIIIPV